MDTYAVITTNGNKVDNVVVWDGKSEWGPGKGYTTVKLKKTSGVTSDVFTIKKRGVRKE
jgi:hypothetical protein